MKMSFRWYGLNDSIPLLYIRQIPGVKGIVTALYDVAVGEEWGLSEIESLSNVVRRAGMEISVIESVPVHEDIKLGRESRDRYIENYCRTLRNISQAGIDTVCYNFMPVFDWVRSSLDTLLDDGSTALSFDQSVVEQMDPLSGALKLPGWDTSYKSAELQETMDAYRDVSEEKLWSNLAYFLNAILPVAEEAGIKMAIHPDDPPWPIFGLPRIIRDFASLKRVTEIYDSPSNGLCICSGSLGANGENDVPGMLRHFGPLGKVNFVHARNIRLTGEQSFCEVAHTSSEGNVDMYEIIKELHAFGYEGSIRPDHGRMIFGESGKPGYGLYDRALGATYLNGLWEAVSKA